MADDKARLRIYGQVMNALGLPSNALDGLKPQEREAVIKGAIERAKSKRTDAEVISMTGINIVVGGKSYEIKPLTINNDLALRKKCGALAGKFIGIIQSVFAGGEGGDISAVMAAALPVVFGEGLNDVVDLMFSLSPELAADRDDIESKCSTPELVDAAMQAFEFVFPFIVALVKGLLRMVEKAQAAGIKLT